MTSRNFASQFYANLPADKVIVPVQVQSAIPEIFDPLAPLISDQLQKMHMRADMTDEQREECSELGSALAPPPIRKVS